MIHKIFEYISDELNGYLKGKFDLTEDIVTMSNLVGLSGDIAVHSENKLVATMVHLERATETGSYGVTVRTPGAQFNETNHPAMPMNIYILISAYFGDKNYSEALKFISETIDFFRQKPLYTQQNSPGLDSSIERFNMEVMDISMSDMVSLWGVLGNHLLPSVLYRVRSIAIDTSALKSLDHKVTATSNSIEVKK